MSGTRASLAGHSSATSSALPSPALLPCRPLPSPVRVLSRPCLIPDWRDPPALRHSGSRAVRGRVIGMHAALLSRRSPVVSRDGPCRIARGRALRVGALRPGKHEYGFHPLAGADPSHSRLRFFDPAFVVPSKRKETARWPATTSPPPSLTSRTARARPATPGWARSSRTCARTARSACR